MGGPRIFRQFIQFQFSLALNASRLYLIYPKLN